MTELLIRSETLFSGLSTGLLLGIGIPASIIGIILWLYGDRFSNVIVGFVGAALGSIVGIMVGTWLSQNLLMYMIGGALILGVITIIFRKVVVFALAVLIITGLSGVGMVSLVLDQLKEDTPQSQPESTQSLTTTESRLAFQAQSFQRLDPNDRQKYLDVISQDKEAFSERLRALLKDTWQTVSPHALKLILITVAGGFVAALLLWLIKNVLVILAYSILGTTLLFLGGQTTLLSIGIQGVTKLGEQGRFLIWGYAVMIIVGCLSQFSELRQRSGKSQAKDSDDDIEEDE